MSKRMAGPVLAVAGLALAGSGSVQAQTPPETTVHLDGRAGGPKFEGIGVVDGGGATSVLLKDYPDPQRRQIFDLLYKPKFGASADVLYVEVPGDGNSTQGSMPSHMHSRDDLNYSRGYIWWVMTEARRRNPRLSLDGAAWSAPGWVGDRGGLLGHPDEPFFSADGVNYYLSWLKGLRDVYGLKLDAMGLRNEKGVSYGFAKALRGALDANGFADIRLHGFDNWQDNRFDFVKDMLTDRALRDAIAAPSAHVSPVEGTRVADETQRMVASMGKPIWNTEQHVYRGGYDGLISTVQSFNEGRVVSGFTRIVDWYGIGALYRMEPYSGEKEALVQANWPWSGRYVVNPKLWAYAHYGQFASIGWTYLNGGGGHLAGGGSYVTLKSPSGDYSVIIETRDAKTPQRLHLDGAHLSRAPLAVWRSTPVDQFVRQADLPRVGGAASMVLEPNAVYTLSTTRGQQKGGFGPPSPAAPFPFPYRDTFDGYGDPSRWGYLPHYFADIDGTFELSACPGRPGGCLRQAAPVRAIAWAPEWMPYTIVGDDGWSDYDVAVDVHLAPGEQAAVMGRINDVGSGYGSIPKGYLLRLSAGGEASLVVVRGKIDKKKPVGDAEQQALIKASADTGTGGEKMLATARLPRLRPGGWHALTLSMQGTTIVGFVDGAEAVRATDPLYAHGMAGLSAGPNGAAMSTPSFDNLSITPVGGKAAAPDGPAEPGTPIYTAAARR